MRPECREQEKHPEAALQQNPVSLGRQFAFALNEGGPMRVRRVSLLISLLAAAAACGDSPPTAPSGAVVGRFGGTGAELVSTKREVQFSTVCGSIRFPQALVPDPNNGSFALGPILVPSRAGTQGAIVLRGTVANGRLLLEYRVLMPSGEAGGTRFELSQDQAPDYTTVACLA
jgi:hypothetical protein